MDNNIITQNKIKDYIEDITDDVSLLMKSPTQFNLSLLKTSLEKFFSEAKCDGIIYTENTDKMMFGLYVMPKINADDVMRIITTGDRYTVTTYSLELDSQLFRPDVNLTAGEIAAVLIHDIGSLVNDSAPSEIVKNNIDQYLQKNNEVIRLSDVVHYKEIFSYGFRDSMRKVTSIFETSNIEKDNDSLITFLDFWGYYDKLISAYTKFKFLLNSSDNGDKLIVMSWIMRLYNDVLHYRIPALQTLEKCKQFTGSQLERKELDNIMRRLNRIDDDMLLESANNLLLDIRKSLRKTSRFSTLLETTIDDVELINTTTEDNGEAPYSDILGTINSKLTMIADYIEEDPCNMMDSEKSQWDSMYNQLEQSRDRLEKGLLYNTDYKMYNKYDGLLEQ